MIKTEKISSPAIRAAAREGLAPYAAALAAHGRFHIDVDRAADLSERACCDFDADAMTSATYIEDKMRESTASLDVIAVMPRWTAARHPKHLQRALNMKMEGKPSFLPITQQPELILNWNQRGRLVALPLAAFDTTQERPSAVLHAMRLEQIVREEEAFIWQRRMVGQSEEEFRAAFEPDISSEALGPQPTVLVDSIPVAREEMGLINYTDTLQLVGLVAVSSHDVSPYDSVIEALQAVPLAT